MSQDLHNQTLAPISANKPAVADVGAVENAIVLWAEASTRAETRDREERLRDKKHIVRSFLKYVGKHPGEVEAADVRAWRKHLESLKSENTVYSYLSRVSSFYEWLRKYPEIKDYIQNNPVSMARPTAPRPYQTEKTRAWTDEEMNAILDQIAAEAERGSIHAMRDYSVTLFYLYSGLRRNEVFGLRGGDIELQEGGLIVRYKRKGGKYQRREVAQADVRDALLAYLKKSKRLTVESGTKRGLTVSPFFPLGGSHGLVFFTDRSECLSRRPIVSLRFKRLPAPVLSRSRCRWRAWHSRRGWS